MTFNHTTYPGLLSLIVEFCRATPISCTHDDNDNPISANPQEFPYGNATCGLICDARHGPLSPMRGGTGNNIYVIPVPHRMSFNTAMILAAVCCVPATLSIVLILIHIYRQNWTNRNGEEPDAPIETTNSATIDKMQSVRAITRLLLSVLELTIFMGLSLALLIMGEVNLFSSQVTYQAEPFASIGSHHF